MEQELSEHMKPSDGRLQHDRWSERIQLIVWKIKMGKYIRMYHKKEKDMGSGRETTRKLEGQSLKYSTQ